MPRSSRKGLIISTLLLALTTVALAFVFYRFDPAHSHFYPRCQFYTVTGLQCPGCGGLRALHELLHGHWREALRLNPLFVLGAPGVLALTTIWWAWQRRNPLEKFTLPTAWIWVGVAIFILFGIVRNLPGVALAGSGL